MKPILGIGLGEAAGIGPELVAKMCAARSFHKYCTPVIIGDKRVLERGMKIANADFDFIVLQDFSSLPDNPDLIYLLNLELMNGKEIKTGELNGASGKAAIAGIFRGLDLCRQGKIDGLVFAPLNKAAVKLGGYDFEDDLSLINTYLHWDKHYGEINVIEGLWTTRATSHIPIKDVSSHLSVEGIVKAVELADTTMKRAGFENPRIAVAALNPHGGEAGTCGREEIDIIAPAVKTAEDRGVNASGPYPADTLFTRAFRGDFDAVVTMYHDQGQIALKLNHFSEGVTVAGGFPYAITTPAHGTAFDIAGKGIADPHAFELAVKIAGEMRNWKERR
jgi:4-hydroxythreonine-4-phosphate dehydrogenase